MRNKDFKNFIVCVVAESGAGKTTIANHLEKRYGYRSIDSYTTRKMRYENEKGHIFINESEVENYRDSMVSYTHFDGNHYFVTKEQLNECDLFVVDPDGVKFLKEKVKDIKIIVVHLNVSMSDRFFRMSKRGDKFKKAMERSKNDETKFANIEYDYSLLNNNVKNVSKLINTIIKDEFGKVNVLKKKLYNIYKRLFK